MSHIHNIIDDDRHFVIDPITRQITNTSSKLVISQYDHDSERFSFEIPRYIEEHDMAECDRIEVHFTNITRTKKEQNDDTYIVEDIRSDRNAVFFSWLVSRNATQLVGSLKFSVTFLCFDDDGNEVYNWGTDIFDSIQVIARLDNTASVVESNPDLIESMKKEILESISSSGGGVDEAQVEKIIENYLTENPPARGDPGKDCTSRTIDVEEIEGGYRITIVDVNDTETFDILNGIDGVAGADGEDGVSPTISVEEIEGGNQLTITDVDGTRTVNILNGLDGTDGKDGDDGADGYSPTVNVETIEGGYHVTITDVNGLQSVDILNGTDGVDGDDGYTPVKGVDYYTEAEKEETTQTILVRLLGGTELKDMMSAMCSQFISIGSTEPENGPVLWFDTTPSEVSLADGEILLVLGDDSDESDVLAEINGSEYPVMNTDSPVVLDENIYAIEINN